MSRFQLQFGAVAAEVSTNCRGLGTRCVNYFGPNDPDLAAPAERIRLDCRIVERPPQAADDWRCICLENGHVARRREDADQITIVVDGEARIGVRPRAHDVTIEATTADALFYHTRKTIRHLVTDALVARGAVMYHAACVATAAGGVMIAGQRNSGKTTAMCALLGLDASAYVANDKLLVLPSGGRVEAMGWPTKVSVCLGTLTAFPELRRHVPRRLRVRSGRTHDELWTHQAGVVFEPHRFTRALGARHLRGVPLAWIVFPDLHYSHRVVTTSGVAIEEVEARLDTCILGVSHSTDHFQFQSWLGTAAPATPAALRASARASIRRVAASTKAMTLRGGGDIQSIRDVVAAALA